MRTELIRNELRRLLRQTPFRPFVLTMENGDRVTIEHPENIAFDPSNGTGAGSSDFYVIAGGLRLFSTFDAVTSVALLDTGQAG